MSSTGSESGSLCVQKVSVVQGVRHVNLETGVATMHVETNYGQQRVESEVCEAVEKAGFKVTPPGA
jgi:predicted class III extradiol MEMO1 family dioxygenase